jgi:phosphoserine aminotransferase
MQGGASLQFSAIPLNLMKDSADYIVTGTWSKKASEEASKYGNVHIPFDSKKSNFTKVEDSKNWNLSKEASYVYYCDNETVHGVEFHETPYVGDSVLIADMSSNLLSKKLDVSKYGVIYACAQKNFGAAGLGSFSFL